jgi:hypothetical protein
MALFHPHYSTHIPYYYSTIITIIVGINYITIPLIFHYWYCFTHMKPPFLSLNYHLLGVPLANPFADSKGQVTSATQKTHHQEDVDQNACAGAKTL